MIFQNDTIQSQEALSTPLKQGSIVMLVIERIKRALITNELVPGDYLPSETELARSLGVGKSSVREAIKMLQAMGILEVHRGQGTKVRESPTQYALDFLVFQMIIAKGVTQDMIDFRAMFEPAYTVMAMHSATPEDIANIRKTIEDFEEALANNTQNARHDVAFHLAVLQATHNSLTIRTGEILMELFATALETSAQRLPKIAVKDHKAILEALLAKDEVGVRAAIRTSALSWEKALTHR